MQLEALQQTVCEPWNIFLDQLSCPLNFHASPRLIGNTIASKLWPCDTAACVNGKCAIIEEARATAELGVTLAASQRERHINVSQHCLDRAIQGMSFEVTGGIYMMF